jgi:hypothetical protein
LYSAGEREVHVSNLDEVEGYFVRGLQSTHMVRTDVKFLSPSSECTKNSHVLANLQLLLLSNRLRIMILLHLNPRSPIVDLVDLHDLLHANTLEATDEREDKDLSPIHIQWRVLATLSIVVRSVVGIEEHPKRQWHQRLLIAWRSLQSLTFGILSLASIPQVASKPLACLNVGSCAVASTAEAATTREGVKAACLTTTESSTTESVGTVSVAIGRSLHGAAIAAISTTSEATTTKHLRRLPQVLPTCRAAQPRRT